LQFWRRSYYAHWIGWIWHRWTALSRAVHDLDGWGYEREDLWGTLRTVSGVERVPSEQGRYHDYYTDFARAVIKGGAPPVTAEEAIETLEVLDAAYLSARECRVVRVKNEVDDR